MTTSDEHPDIELVELSLRDRMPDYLAIFGAGAAGALVVALVATLFGPTFRNSFVNILIGYTVLLFLMGGTAGGGYSNLGLGALAAVSRRGRGAETLDDRLRRGLRPERNPRAFWQVIAGLCYLGIAVAVLTLS